MNQDSNLTQKQQKDQSDLHLSNDASDQSQINELQVQRAIRVLGKVKKIEKKGLLCKFKSKSKINNLLFQRMSQFFHQKHKKKIQQKEKIIEQKKIMSRRRFETSINSFIVQTSINPQAQKYQQVISTQDQQEQTDHHSFSTIYCHICFKPYTEVHHFYGWLCSECASFNWNKRTQRTSMKGLTALVTGARIKIGYEITLRLLREGARVYATSRFPNDAVIRYKKEKDYNEWKQNLFIIQCDFLSQAQVTALISYIQQSVDKLDILINNAAQTIVRPKEFYTQEIKNEQLCLENPHQIQCLTLECSNKEKNEYVPSLYANSISVLPGEIDLQHKDEFGQPVDKRKTNSWVQLIQDVSLLDCYTTQVINSIVPFHLISQLKNKMIGSTPSWIINVSSMEGVFYRSSKQQFHPHTNMAKAALNMITRTSAPEFKNHNIFMNSVDTGWVTNQNPFHIAQKMEQQHRFKCPLDCLDGAMRVLDPIYLGLTKQQYPYGQFIKNYKESNW